MTLHGHQNVIITSAREGFRVAWGGRNLSVFSCAWRDIVRVDAYKLDIWSTDLLCLCVTGPDGEIEVDEEMPGWDTLVQHLEQQLAGFPPSDAWWSGVVFPAFVRNERVLFQREPG